MEVVFKIVSPASQVGLELDVWLRMTLNFGSSCFLLILSARVKGMHLYALFIYSDETGTQASCMGGKKSTYRVASLVLITVIFCMACKCCGIVGNEYWVHI